MLEHVCTVSNENKTVLPGIFLEFIYSPLSLFEKFQTQTILQFSMAVLEPVAKSQAGSLGVYVLFKVFFF